MSEILGRILPASHGRKNTSYPPGFEKCWEAYPHYGQRSVKGKAFKVWQRQKLEDTSIAVLDWIEAASPDWAIEGGKYVQGFQVWLNGRDFDSPPPQTPQEAPGGDFDAKVAQSAKEFLRTGKATTEAEALEMARVYRSGGPT